MEDSNVMKILVATDNHLGYKEKDSVREKDSFNTFEEIFTIAKDRDVDFVLLGGDLFHDNKPSRKSLHSCMEIMRKHCMGSRPSQIEVVSDQAVDFGHTSKTITCVNYEDPNLNISLPVFSIHGNHDDPAGSGSLSAIDLLSVAGLLNHFGKTTNLERVQISPILLQKGSTKLALYGLGSVRDERLHRLFVKEKVEFLRPKENTERWFNIMVIHQNRAQHGQTNYIPEQFLDDFFDLVIWGHEHECLIEPQWNSLKNFFIMQPGSSVATSLSPGESKQKQVAVLSIRGREMKTDAIPLKTVRNMYVEDIVLSQISCISCDNEARAEKEIKRYCEERVLALVERSRMELTGHPKQPKNPLIRLRIDYTGGYPTFNPHRLGDKFSETVANADGIIHFLKKSTRGQVKKEKYDMSDIDDLVVKEVVDKIRVEQLVEEFLSATDEKSQMALLTAKGMSAAVREYIEKKEKDAICDICDYQLDKMSSHLKQIPTLVLDQDSIVHQIARYKQERKVAVQSATAAGGDVDDENEETFEEIRTKMKKGRRQREVTILDSDDDILLEPEPSSTAKSGRGRGSKRGSRGSTTRRGRGGKASVKPPLAVLEVPRRGRNAGNIMDAFKAASQRSVMQKTDTITEVMESDEEEQAPAPQVTKKRAVPKRRRGVDFSSDEEEHPMGSFLSSRKRR